MAQARAAGAASSCPSRAGRRILLAPSGWPTTSRQSVGRLAVAIYITGGTYQGSSVPSGWNAIGGTSAASPLVAAIAAVTGNGAATPLFSYANTKAFYDVTTGTNGSCSGAQSYFCSAGVGYDGPTGNGTPNGQALAQLGAGGSNTDGGNSSMAQVSFQVDNATTVPGQNMYVVGNAPELGSWSVNQAVELSPTNYPTWTASVSLPQGLAVQFKFIKMDGSSNVTWETGANQQLVVPSTTAGSVDLSWQ